MSKIRIIIAGFITLIMGGVVVAIILMFIHAASFLNIIYLMVGIILIEIVFSIYIINSRRHIYTKLSWLFTIILFPLVGCFFFCLFGFAPFTRKRWIDNLKNDTKYIKYENYKYSSKWRKQNNDIANIFKYVLNNGFKPIYQNNDIKIITSSNDLYSQVIDAIRGAQKFIHLSTFIIADGVFLRTLFTELIKKAQEGVKIRFLYDWLGSAFRYHKRDLKQLRAAGIEVGIFNPKGINVFKGSSNYRMHHKSLIVDNKLALYGGSNFGDDYLSMNAKCHHWRDINFSISGEIVNSINICFCRDWLEFTDYSVSDMNKQELKQSFADILKIHKVNKKIDMQFIIEEPNSQEKNLMNVLINLFNKARHSIKIVTPYFLPTEGITSALTTAAWSGVKVEILLPGKPDNKRFIIPMNRGEYKSMLDAKCSIYEYNGFVHAKYYIIDNKYVLIGSCNLDFRSLLMHFENGILINNSTFAKQLSEVFNKDKLNSEAVTIASWQRQRILRIRILTSLINLYKPML